MILFLGWNNCTIAQKKYSPQAIFSHNDYLAAKPFQGAYREKAGFVEADIFLQDQALLVAHTQAEIKPINTLQRLYLEPLLRCLLKNKGRIYKNPEYRLVCMLDIKSEAVTTMDAILKALQAVPELIQPGSGIQFVISGNRPSADNWHSYPDFIWFDGRPMENYIDKEKARLAFISDSFTRYTDWQGIGELPLKDQAALESIINRSHGMNKPLRFWATRDTIPVWEKLMQIQVDILGTDRVAALSRFIRKKK
jgi:alkaline phosphatase